MSRTRKGGGCPHGKRNCGVGCSREDLNRVRDARAVTVEEFDDAPDPRNPCDYGTCADCWSEDVEIELIDRSDLPCNCRGAPPYHMTECGAQDAWLKARGA